jgi:DNA adenine methylase
LRLKYLEAYQELVLSEPESSVSQPLKEAFLALRQAAESEG